MDRGGGFLWSALDWTYRELPMGVRRLCTSQCSRSSSGDAGSAHAGTVELVL